MTLPFDPHKTTGVIMIIPQADYTARSCDTCKQPCWITAEARGLADQHELPAMCPSCAQKYIKAAVMEDKASEGHS